MTASQIKQNYPAIGNMQDEAGNSILHRLVSIAYASYDFAPLLEAGCDTFTKNARGEPPLDIATEFVKGPLKAAAQRHETKQISKALEEILGEVAAKGSIERKEQEQFVSIKEACSRLTSLDGKEKALLAKHLEGIIREAAKDPGVNMEVKRTWKEWVFDLKNSIFNRGEKQKVKEMIGYEGLVNTMRAKSKERNEQAVGRINATLDSLGLIKSGTSRRR